MPGGVERLREQILAAFPAMQFVAPVTDCSCEECTEIIRNLQDKSWDQGEPAFIDFTCCPVLLTPEAFRAFLPAYLLRALDDLAGKTNVLEFTVYSLCPEETRDNPRIGERARLMSPTQVSAIREFLLYAARHTAEAEYLQPFVSAGLETIWM